MSALRKVLVVGTASTPGQAVSSSEVATLLTDAGLDVEVVYPRRGTRRWPYPLIDLLQARTYRRALLRASRRTRPDVVILSSITAAMLLPAATLRTAAIRFDALSSENRPERRNSVQHRLERRALRHAPLLLPYSSRPLAGLPRDVVALPTALSLGTDDGRPRRGYLAYAGNPHKKGLDLVVRAWARSAAAASDTLTVCGLSEAAARDYLGGDAPASMRFTGQLDRAEVLALLDGAIGLVSASRYEDFGIMQLECLARGGVLITTRSPGPYEALRLQADCPRILVAETGDPADLARAIDAAPAVRDATDGARLGELLEPYTAEHIARTVREQLIPRLEEIAAGC